MEKERLNRYRTVSLVVVAAWLVALTIGLGVMMSFLLGESPESALEIKKLHLRMAFACLAMLGGTLVLLLWTVMRYFRYRTLDSKAVEPTPYVDAWAIAGQRIKVDPSEEDEETKGYGEGADEDSGD